MQLWLIDTSFHENTSRDSVKETKLWHWNGGSLGVEKNQRTWFFEAVTKHLRKDIPGPFRWQLELNKFYSVPEALFPVITNISSLNMTHMYIDYLHSSSLKYIYISFFLLLLYFDRQYKLISPQPSSESI